MSMTSNHYSLEVIPEVNSTDIVVDSDHELEELQEIMNNICNEIANKFYKLKTQSLRVSDILEKNFDKSYLNTNFDHQELIEEQIDNLIYQYQKIKQNLRDGREIRCYIEKKENQKNNELRYARNLLAHFGIDPIT